MFIFFFFVFYLFINFRETRAQSDSIARNDNKHITSGASIFFQAVQFCSGGAAAAFSR